MSDFHGRFIWYELMTPDVAGAKRFYGEVVGWTSSEMGMPGMTYTIFEAGGNGVGGAMPLTDEAKAQGVPPNWTGYVAVDDVDASAARVPELGGTVMRPPQDIPGVGRFAIIADPTGAVVAIMTPAPPEGSRPDMPRGTMGGCSWHELYAGDLQKAWTFYETLFGWSKTEVLDMGPEMGPYQIFTSRGDQGGGAMRKPDNVPVAAWVFYFQVGDIDAAAGRVTGAGGQVLMGPMEVPNSEWVLQGTDPQGALFALVGKKTA